MAKETYESFIENDLLMAGVSREFEIIGEAMNQIPQAIKDAHSEIPFSTIIGMRNRIIHDYIELDTRIVWDTYKEGLPILKAQITKVLET